MKNIKRNLLYTSIIAFQCACSISQACVIPVFRYALERWDGAPYECRVFYKGTLTENDKKWAEQLARAEGSLAANMKLKEIDISTLPDSLRKNAERELDGKQLPWIKLHYPQDNYADLYVFPTSPLAWEGRLSEVNVQSILQSPTRKEISRRIKEGETLVWVLLQSGNEKKDAKVKAVLERQMKMLNSELKLPPLSSDIPWWFDAYKGPEMRVQFSVVTLSRDDKSESLLLDMLLKYPGKKLDTVTGPIVFGVFGQGRALPPLTAEKIAPKVLKNVCQFIIGNCSCEVKELNPGIDLLFAANWQDRSKVEKSIMGENAEFVSPPELTGMTAMPIKEVFAKDTTEKNASDHSLTK